MLKKDIAEKVGISPTHISDIIHGRKRPSPDLALKLEKVTGVSRLAWLYPDEYELRKRVA